MVKQLIGNDRLEVHYGIDADIWHGGGIWDGCSNARNKKSLQLVIENSSHEIGSPILDVGFGNSLMREMLMDKFRIIETSDLNMDCEPYPKSWTDRFQTIFSFETIEHLLNPLFHLRELWRIIRPGGYLYIVTPNDYSLVYKVQHILSLKHPTHFHQFNVRELRALLKIAGWRVENAIKFHRKDTGLVSKISRNGLFIEATPNEK